MNNYSLLIFFLSAFFNFCFPFTTENKIQRICCFFHFFSNFPHYSVQEQISPEYLTSFNSHMMNAFKSVFISSISFFLFRETWVRPWIWCSCYCHCISYVLFDQANTKKFFSSHCGRVCWKVGKQCYRGIDIGTRDSGHNNTQQTKRNSINELTNILIVHKKYQQEPVELGNYPFNIIFRK